MNLQNKKKKLSIRVVIHPCKASAAGVYSLAIRVLYCRKKKEYSLGWRVHESNYRRDADRVVYSSEGILTRREVSLVNRLIRNEKEDLVRNYRLLERTAPGFTLERLMLKHRKEQYDQSVDKFILRYPARRGEAKHCRFLHKRAVLAVAFLQFEENQLQRHRLCVRHGLYTLPAHARHFGEQHPHVPQQFPGGVQ